MHRPLLLILLVTGCREPPPDMVLPAGPCLAASPSSVEFGEVETGTRASAFVRLTNLTSRLLSLSGARPEAPFLSDFIPTQLEARESIDLGLEFFASDGLLHHGTLLVEAEGCSLEVPMRGLGSGKIALPPNVLDFGPVEPGQRRSLELSFSNSRRSAEVLDVRLFASGDAAEIFSLEFTQPLTLPAGAITTVTVTASPLAYEDSQATLVFTGRELSHAVRLNVAGGVPVANLSPALIDVPKMDYADFVERRLWLRNDAIEGSAQGALRLVDPFVRIQSDDGGLTDDIEVMLDRVPLRAGEEMEVLLDVRPLRAGTHRYRLTFFTNDPQRPEQRVELNVNAMALQPCSLQRPSAVQFTAAADAGSIGMVRFTNLTGHGCVLDSVHVPRSSPGFQITAGGVDQLELAPGEAHDVWLSGPDAGSGFDAGVLSFHVLEPNGAVQHVGLIPSP